MVDPYTVTTVLVVPRISWSVGYQFYPLTHGSFLGGLGLRFSQFLLILPLLLLESSIFLHGNNTHHIDHMSTRLFPLGDHVVKSTRLHYHHDLLH